jgi:hypothetical protein
MASDVKLQGEQVRVEAWDLVLDASDRRKTPGGDRRALVHDHGDALTLNWAHDYPGGVQLQGVRLITKDPHFIMGVTVDGGLHVRGGALQMAEGRKIILSDADPTDDFASGEIYQTDEGLQVAGGRFDHGTQQKPVHLENAVARKTIKWGDWSRETVSRVGTRARPGGGSSASARAITLLAGAALANNRVAAVPIGGATVAEFDIVDTFIQLLDELSELRARVTALEAGANA